MNTTSADTMAYVGQCETYRSPVNPYNMLTIVSDEPLPPKVPGGTGFPIKLLFKISGDWANVIAPYRQGKSMSYDLPSLAVLEPYRMATNTNAKTAAKMTSTIHPFFRKVETTTQTADKMSSNKTINDLVKEMGMTEWKNIDELLMILAKYCIAKNFYRKQGINYAHEFTKNELSVINRHSATTKPKLRIDGGYMFLDDDGGREGMIRLYAHKGNPKWSFWEEEGEMKIDYA